MYSLNGTKEQIRLAVRLRNKLGFSVAAVRRLDVRLRTALDVVLDLREVVDAVQVLLDLRVRLEDVRLQQLEGVQALRKHEVDPGHA